MLLISPRAAQAHSSKEGLALLIQLGIKIQILGGQNAELVGPLKLGQGQRAQSDWLLVSQFVHLCPKLWLFQAVALLQAGCLGLPGKWEMAGGERGRRMRSGESWKVQT